MQRSFSLKWQKHRFKQIIDVCLRIRDRMKKKCISVTNDTHTMIHPFNLNKLIQSIIENANKTS